MSVRAWVSGWVGGCAVRGWEVGRGFLNPPGP